MNLTDAYQMVMTRQTLAVARAEGTARHREAVEARRRESRGGGRTSRVLQVLAGRRVTPQACCPA